MTVQLRDSDGTVRLAGDLLATGGATGDVLTQQADGTYAPAAGGGSQPFDSVEIQAPAEGKVFDAFLDTNADAEISMEMDTSGPVMLNLSAGEGAGGLAALDLSDDDLDGHVSLSSAGGSFVLGRTTAASSSSILDLGTVTRSNLRILRDGVIVIRLHGAPADGDLGAGDCALWFDQTNGAGKLMIKAKTADGTVATAAVALA